MSEENTSAGELFLDGVEQRVKSGFFALILPFLLQLFQGLADNCPAEQTEADLVDACINPSRQQKRQITSQLIADCLSIRRENGWGILKAGRIGSEHANALFAEAKETAARVSGENSTSLIDLLRELRQSA